MTPALLLLLVTGCNPDLVDTGDTAAPAPPPRLLLISADPLVEAASAYGNWRFDAGWEVEEISAGELAESGDLGEALGDAVADFADDAAPDQVSHVLLVGDAREDSPDDTDYLPVAEAAGGYVGDAPYADFDGDTVPDLPIGRLPFNEPHEVEAYLERARAYEEGYVIGEHNRRIQLFTGEGGFGDAIDGILEWAAGLIVEEIDYGFDIAITTSIEGSSWYLPEDAWVEAWNDAWEQGSVLQTYVGHTLYGVDAEALSTSQRPSLLGFLACSNGTFQDPPHPYASLAEEMLVSEVGPVATLAATTESDPYGNALLAREISHALFNERVPTVGEAIRQVKSNMVYREDELREMLDGAASLYLDDLEALVEAHVVMYNLLGDPTLSTLLPPGEVEIDAPDTSAERGGDLAVTGTVSCGDTGSGEVHVTLEIQRSELLHELEDTEDPFTDPAVHEQNHALANDKVAAGTTADLHGGAFEAVLSVPEDLPEGAEWYLKAYAWTGSCDAVGSRRVDLLGG